MPRHFFRDDKSGGSMPSSVAVAFQAPSALAHLPRNQYAATITGRLDIATDELRKSGRAVLGPKKIIAQRWGDSPSTPEPRRQLSPTVACRDKWLRTERLEMNKAFQKVYSDAFEAFRKGLEAIFPLGTWAMRFRAAIAISTA
jgi:hypothetical protein